MIDDWNLGIAYLLMHPYVGNQLAKIVIPYFLFVAPPDGLQDVVNARQPNHARE